MNKEYAVCRTKCRFAAGCDPNLIPERITTTGAIIPIEPNDTVSSGYNCARFTCGNSGLQAALAAKKSILKLPYVVLMPDGKTGTVWATIFGSKDKPTHRNGGRIITKKGLIFALQNGLYYFAGQRVINKYQVTSVP